MLNLSIHRKSLLSLFLLILLFSCSMEDDIVTDLDEDSSASNSVMVSNPTWTASTLLGKQDTGENADDLIANSTFSGVVKITFGTEIKIENPYEAGKVDVSVTGGDVTVTSTISEVEYELSGSSTNGSVKIYSEKKFKLTLAGLSLTNSDGPALNIQSGKRVFVILKDNTTNTLKDGTAYATAPNEEDQKATFFSEGQLIFSGTGELVLEGNYKHALASDDYIRVIDGNITITKAASDGIHTNDAFIADGGKFNIKASSDGIEVEEGFLIVNKGDFELNVVDDALVASYEEGDPAIDPYLIINGGTFVINTTEGEGIESKSTVTINAGTIVAKTVDDAINAGTAIYINGGKIFAQSTGNDAIDSNGVIGISGGITIAIGSRDPEGGFDADRSNFSITGGLVLGLGGTTSSPTASTSDLYSVVADGGIANQIIHIETTAGEDILTFLAPTSNNTLLFASEKLKAGTSYSLYLGGSVTDGSHSNGLYESGTYTKGTLSKTFTPSAKITQIGGRIF